MYMYRMKVFTRRRYHNKKLMKKALITEGLSSMRKYQGQWMFCRASKNVEFCKMQAGKQSSEGVPRCPHGPQN